MQRSSWASGRSQVDAEEARGRSYSYSKAPRFKQGLSRDFRLALQQGKLTRGVASTVAIVFCLILIIWGLTVQLDVYHKSSNFSKFKTPEEKLLDFQKQVDLLIEKTEAERQSAMSQLEPAFKEWQDLKVTASKARERVRDSKADLSSMEELHSQRLNILPAATTEKEAQIQYGTHKESADDLKDTWQQELQTAKDTLQQVAEQDKDMMYQESRARHRVESLRQDVQALGAALAEFMDQRRSPTPKPLRGALQPGNRFDHKLLLDVFAKNLEGLTNKRSLRDQQIEKQAAAVLRSLEHPIVGSPKQNGPLADEITRESLDDAERHALSHSLNGEGLAEGVLAGRASEVAGVRDEAAQPVEGGSAAAPNAEAAKSQEEGQGGDASSNSQATIGRATDSVRQQQQQQLDTKDAQVEDGSTKAAKSGGSRAMLPDAVAEEPHTWLSQHWANRGNGIIGPQDIDTSLRCEMSGLCEGIAACKQGLDNNLGCISESHKRQERVQEAAKWAWDAYRKHAFGKDELLPLSQSSNTWFDLGLTLLDSLDTLLLLGLDAEYDEARKWVLHDLRLDPDSVVNLFETTIRALGGLLAAFHLSNGDKAMLYKAASLALRLLPAFGSTTGIPFSDVNLRTHSAEQPKWTTFSSLSEVTTLALEFSFMSRATGDKQPEALALGTVHKVLETAGRRDGLAPIFVDIATGRLHGQLITLGARGDSYYEYLLKQWLLTGKRDQHLLRGYETAMRGVRKHMLMRTDQDGLLFAGELSGLSKIGKMDHLVCFLPGLLALGHHHGLNTAAEGEPDDLEVAEDFMRTCYEMYRRTPTGLAPEIAFFKSSEAKHAAPVNEDERPGAGDFIVKRFDAHNLLRPETMESLFVLWRVTGKPHFREWAWMIFRAFQMHTRVETGGYANLDNCLEVPPPKRDKMESFWLAETLKYLYLILDDSSPTLMSLDEYVFNTEAHPLPLEGSLADITAGHAYESKPYSGLANQTLDNRIQYWEDLARLEAGKTHKRRRLT